ncbi:hypothetical protein SAMN05192561_1017 [Halopenitus malekzadehii]|uniref:Uncharacterized protein n=1 Tax=Halopenitus malekzadehii TaxID=1267564 RepID=A0A1H6HQK7_9EURY|nr:hypothetical protein [Halopenitus malekzadehii]SEH36475.1 hypothetical protein SAMN05192561_1017 [Halopenitus malekzadehii]
MVSHTRLYGAAIAVASGLYSVTSAITGSRMGVGGWIMGLIGVVVIVHGVALLTDAATRLGGVSGPLMVGYAVVMLLLQILYGVGMLAVGGTSGMAGGGMTGGGAGMGVTAGMGWDAGMVALALLMLVSGLVMTRDGPTESGRRM